MACLHAAAAGYRAAGVRAFLGAWPQEEPRNYPERQSLAEHPNKCTSFRLQPSGYPALYLGCLGYLGQRRSDAERRSGQPRFRWLAVCDRRCAAVMRLHGAAAVRRAGRARARRQAADRAGAAGPGQDGGLPPTVAALHRRAAQARGGEMQPARCPAEMLPGFLARLPSERKRTHARTCLGPHRVSRSWWRLTTRSAVRRLCSRALPPS